MIKLATAVSSYPFYNFRYLKLLSEFSRYFFLYVFAASKLKKIEDRDDDKYYKVYYHLPSLIPRRIKYYIKDMTSQVLINLVRPDIVWIFDIIGPLIPITIEKPIVLDIDDPIFTRRNRLSLVKDLYILRNRHLKKVVVTTSMIKEKFIKYYNVPEDKIEVIPNGVDLKLFKPTELPMEDIILYYGTLAPHRSRFLVKVIEKVLTLRDDIRFIIIGDAPEWFKKYLVKKDLAGNVIMPGFIEHDKLPSWIEKAKICVFTQDIPLGGRFPFKLIEYMASGRPIVATDVDESWPVRESGAGIITPIDPKIFVENVIKLLEDRKLAEELAKRGIDYARKFSWDQIVKKYIELFMKIIEE